MNIRGPTEEAGAAFGKKPNEINTGFLEMVPGAGWANGAQGRDRTTDTAIFNRMLYQLSYLGAKLGPNRLGKQSAGVIEAGFHPVQNTPSGK